MKSFLGDPIRGYEVGIIIAMDLDKTVEGYMMYGWFNHRE